MNEASQARDLATIRQRRAADPYISSWVSASAGSGKTKVLTDRVLRLLLREKAAPGRILCLTFTKAAAAEMQTRLADRLGKWSAMPEEALRAELAKLFDLPPTQDDVAAARRLFCRVLEQPGGMRILTIHAFCQSLLQSFPLEAELPPGFAMLEEADSDALLAEAREAALASGAIDADALTSLSRLVSADGLGGAIRVLHRHRARVEPILAGSPDAAALLHGCLGLPHGECEDDVAALLASPPEDVVAAARLLAEHRNKTSRDLGARMLAFLSCPPAERAAAEWWGCLHTDKGDPRAALKHDDAFARESARVAELEARRTAHRLRAATHALLSAARPVLRDYERRKARRGALDFDDLIARAQALLLNPGSAWVLFKLDGGLDHILLDEAQDTNPAQWAIAEAIAAEFFAGTGTREAGTRTFFAVGDAKQSIFGFQGADARGFLTRQDTFGRMVETGGGTFVSVPLSVSFRSCSPILALVDRVFEDGAARAGVVEGEDRLEHSTDRAGHAGHVEIWPPLERPAKDEVAPWVVPEVPVPAGNAEAQLADAIAARIRHMVDHETLLARGDRPIGFGDIMVLVRRRTQFVELLVSALKQRDVHVGGVDRLKLVDQIAVTDVMALLDVLLLPEDDLSLAAALKSPLIGLGEDDLFSICCGRDGHLWHALRERGDEPGAIGRAATYVSDLMDRTDYVTPHALMSEILGEGGGRARLLARLGTEAAEALDELMSAAIRYEARNPPSLQGFLHWLRAGGATVKRETENAGDAVRIMTAHGSKGLQAPVVIIPDIGRGGARDTLMWSSTAGSGANQPTIPLWAPRKEFQARAWRDAKSADEERQDEEENRLLYVALTRAEDRLIVCGIAPAKATPHPPWHQQVKDGFFRGHDRGDDGFARVPFDPASFGYAGGGTFGEEGWEIRCAQTVEPRPEPAALCAEAAVLPRWATERAAPEASEDPVAPSRTEGEEGPAAAPHGVADPGGRRFRRGLLIHAMLQFLPDHPAEAREGIARRHLARPGHGLTAEEQAATWEEVRGVMEHPALSGAFAPGSLAEAPLAGTVNGRAVAGQVDRLWIGPDRVIVVDYKTNRPPPVRPEDVSPAYLRQMAAYRAVLRAGWPGRRVDCALVWTWSGQVMTLPDDLLDPHAPRG